jgi:hypothetical protein
MLSLWVGCVVMGSFYLVSFGGGNRPEFIIGQIVLGVVGAAREMYLKRYVLK